MFQINTNHDSNIVNIQINVTQKVNIHFLLCWKWTVFYVKCIMHQVFQLFPNHLLIFLNHWCDFVWQSCHSLSDVPIWAIMYCGKPHSLSQQHPQLTDSHSMTCGLNKQRIPINSPILLFRSFSVDLRSLFSAALEV